MSTLNGTGEVISSLLIQIVLTVPQIFKNDKGEFICVALPELYAGGVPET